MILSKTKEILKRLYTKYSDDLKYAKKDIKPDYSVRGDGDGYSYFGIEDSDRDFIYKAIGGLTTSVNDVYGPIYFDIENHFITEAKAVKELNVLKDFIAEDITKLKDMQKKYEGKEHSQYPIQVCLSYHEQVYEILEEIYNSEEFTEFLRPGQISKLKSENYELRFNDYWRKLKRKYIIHLIAFIPFLILTGWVITHKDDEGFSNFGKASILIVVGIITMLFNLLFNNHNSFKDSWKLILTSSRDKLKGKEKEKFLNAQEEMIMKTASY